VIYYNQGKGMRPKEKEIKIMTTLAIILIGANIVVDIIGFVVIIKNEFF
jgi:hypothetical protein